jgi:hypothetical protein
MRARATQALADLLSGSQDRCVTRSLGPYIGIQAMCLHSLGNHQEAGQIVDSLRAAFTGSGAADSTSSPVLRARGLAEYYAWSGNVPESIAWLERAFAISPNGEEFRVLSSGVYDRVRADPRFNAALKRIKEQVYDRVQWARREAAVR